MPSHEANVSRLRTCTPLWKSGKVLFLNFARRAVYRKLFLEATRGHHANYSLHSE